MQARANSAGNDLEEPSTNHRASLVSAGDDGSLSLEDSLAMTPWERILANDDMVNFGDSLRTAMEKRNAKPR